MVPVSGRRLLVWGLAWLLVVPPVMGGAEMVSGDGIIFTLPEVRQGDRYVYDLDVVAEHEGVNMTIPSAFVLEVHPLAEVMLPDGRIEDAVVLEQRTRYLPRADHLGLPEGDPRGETLLRVYYSSDGAPRFSETINTKVQTVVNATGTHHVHQESSFTLPMRYNSSARGGFSLSGPTSMLDRGIIPGPGASFNDQGFVGDLVASFMGVGSTDVSAIGTYQGKKVYEVNGKQEYMRGHSCPMPNIAIEFQGADLGVIRHESRGLWLEHGIWYRPDLPLPVLFTSHCLYGPEDAAGSEGTARVSLRLVADERGEGPELLPLGRREMVHELEPTVSAERRSQNGLPPYQDDLFPFPLEAAYDALRASDDPDLATARGTDGDFRVAWLTYERNGYPGAQCPEIPPSDLEYMLPIAAPTPEPERPVDCPLWRFILLRDGDEPARATVYRLEYPNGSSEHRVETMNQWSYGAYHMGSPPERLAPLDDVLRLWAQREGVDPQRWLDDGSAQVTFGWDQDDWTYAMGRPYAPDPSGIRYRATDGAFLFHSESSQQATPQRVDPWTPQGHTTEVVHPIPGTAEAAVASGAVLTLLWLLGLFWNSIRAALVLPLYAKIRRDRVLDHHLRDQIRETVAANPGVSMADLERHCGVGHGTMVHHLRMLEANQVLTSRSVGRSRHYFLHGAYDASRLAALSLLAQESPRRTYEVLKAHPGVMQKELAELLRVSHTAARFQVKRLERAGLVEGRRDGRETRYWPSP